MKRWVRKKKKKRRPIPSRLRNQEANSQSSEIFLWNLSDCTTQGQMRKSQGSRDKKRARAPVDPGGKGRDRARFPFSYSLVVPLWFLFVKPRKRNR